MQSIFNAHFSQKKPLSHLALLLGEHCTLEKVNDLVVNLLQNPNSLTDIANRSYQHGNGFAKIVLLDHDYKLRLHIWLDDSYSEQNIHNHRWDFASYILYGTLHDEIWQISSESNIVDGANSICLARYEYFARTARQKASKRYVEDVKLSRLSENFHIPKTAYTMKSHVLHKINKPCGMVATIMCTTPPSKSTNSLFPLTNATSLSPKNLNLFEIEVILNQFLKNQSN